MILSGQSIRKRNSLLQPFHERTVFGGMTFGLGPAGYDVRVRERLYIRPGECVLASTVEHFNMPLDLMAYVKDKSSWARLFMFVQNTVIEPGWRGFLTLELSNGGSTATLIEPGSPIAQIVFHQLDQPAESPYAGKYQDQRAGAVPYVHELP